MVKSVKLSSYITLLLTGVLSHAFWATIVRSGPISGDAIFYLAMAENLRNYGVYGTGYTQEFYRAPLYSIFLWFTSFLPGNWPTVSVVVQHVLTIGVGLFCYSRLRGWNPRVAFVWAALWMSSPFAALNDMLILQESFYTNLLMIAATIAFSALPQISRLESVVIGVLLAAVVWVRDVYLLMPLAFAIVFFWTMGFSAWKKVMLMLSAFIIAIAPWMARNASIEGGGFFMSKGIAGMSMFVGTWQSDANWKNSWLQGVDLPEHAFDSEQERERLIKAMQTRNDEVLKAEALRRITDRPVQIISIWMQRSYTMWVGTRSDLLSLRVERGGVIWMLCKATLWGTNALVLTFGLLGLILYGFRKTPLLFFSAIIIYIYLIYLPFLNIETRYSMPAIVWLYFFVALLGVNIFEVWRQRSSRVLHL